MDNSDSLNKPTWKPRFVSEFSMGELDFRRYDKWLERTELSSAAINSTEIPNLDMVQRYFSELNVLYKSWRPLISIPKVTEELDSAMNQAKKLKRTWESSNKSGLPNNKIQILSLVDLLDSIHTKLLYIKQVVGLGIIVKRNLSTAQKIKRGVRGDRDLDNLPEA